MASESDALRNLPRALAWIGAFAALAAPATAADFIGPDPTADVFLDVSYLGFADSPFLTVDFSAGYFYLEDWETADALQPITTPGVTATAGGPVSVVFGPSIHDSVDEDDGVIDGSGLMGESWYSSAGPTGISFLFSPVAPGIYPTHVGIVWTDGGGSAVVTFEAWDANGVSLGTISGSHADASVNGETAEDRFYGVIDRLGISEIRISHTSGGLEVDHLQYGTVPEPGLAAGLAIATLGLGGLARARRSRA